MGEQKQLSFCPKNVRQIGEIKGNYKIYIEDYVITFFNQISKKGEIGSRALLLLGEKQEGTFIINGAICSEKQRLEEGLPIFDKEEIEILSSIKKEDFSQMEILGWAIVESQFNAISDETLFKDMGEELKKEGKIVFRIEAEENKESIWIHKNGMTIPIAGYQIFYDSNIAMQNYLIKWNNHQKNPPLEHVRDVAIKQFRTTITEKKEVQSQNKIMAFFYTASTLMLVIMCAMGITMLNNYEKLVRVETAMNHLIETMENEQEMKVWSNNVEERTESIVEQNTVKQEVVLQEVAPSISQNEVASSETQNTVLSETSNVIEKPNEYIACKGDNLSKISMRFYNTPKMIKQICEVNNIENPDSIKEGDRILLP